jgi:hypothetical protein
MKIKVWALIVIILGSVAVGGIGMFAAVNGFTTVASILGEARQARTVQLPQNRGFLQGGQGNNQGGNEQQDQQPSALPAGFNAGVSIEAVYAQMTNQTVEQVQTAENDAQTSVWGLAQKDGKLDELKQKVAAAVTDSLKKMVSDGKITQSQSDSYMAWVNQYLKTIGQTNAYGAMPGNSRGGRSNRQFIPWATAKPGSAS